MWNNRQADMWEKVQCNIWSAGQTTPCKAVKVDDIYLKEREVPVAFDLSYFQVSHNDFTTLISLLDQVVLIFLRACGAQSVLRTRTHHWHTGGKIHVIQSLKRTGDLKRLMQWTSFIWVMKEWWVRRCFILSTTRYKYFVFHYCCVWNDFMCFFI